MHLYFLKESTPTLSPLLRGFCGYELIYSKTVIITKILLQPKECRLLSESLNIGFFPLFKWTHSVCKGQPELCN